MHRSICRLAESSSSVLPANSRRHISTAARRKPRDPIRLSKQEYDKVELTSKGIAAAAAKKANKPNWKHPKSRDGETIRLTQAVKNQANPAPLPSLEKQQFYSEVNEFASGINLPQFEVVGKSLEFKPGTMVEIRRSETTMRGVVLFELRTSMATVVHTLTVSGEVWPHTQNDVMFAIPSFVSDDLITRCGMNMFAREERDIAARVQVLKRLRDFQSVMERQWTEHHRELKQIYEKARHPQPDEWASITLEQAARLIDPDSAEIPLMTKYVTHSYLFERNKHFVPDQTQYLATETFWVRPQAHIEDIDAVDRMVSRNDPRLDAFIEKAKRLILAARERESTTLRSPFSFEEDTSTSFNADDMTFIRFLRHSIRHRRSTQRDPYLSSQTSILKKIELYSDSTISSATTHQLLVDIGVLPPWEDLITREESTYSGLAAGPKFEVQTSPTVTPQTSARTASQSQPLGPDDFYSHDIVDSLRHDFGDMPVYVVDDITAEELDDGISIEEIPSEPGKVWLHVHIADPTALIPPTHSVARHAYEQNETLYFIDRSVPMLPPHSIVGASLGEPGMDYQKVMTFSAKVDGEGNIVEYKVRPGIVRNVHVLQYDAVDIAMGQPLVPVSYPFGEPATPKAVGDVSRVTPPILKDMNLLKKTTTAIVGERLRNDALSFALPLATVGLQPRPLPDVPRVTSAPYAWSGFPALTYMVEENQRTEVGTRAMVAEAMRAACRVASRFFRDRGVPALRRASGVPGSIAAGALHKALAARDAQGLVDFFLTLELGIVYSASEYVTAPAAHAVLGIPEGEGYTRVTSPLRRFNDMLAHWQIKHALLAPAAPHLVPDDRLRALGAQIASRETHNRRVARAQTQFWAHRFLERWQAARASGAGDGPDPLQTLVARPAEVAAWNGWKQYYQQHVHLPGLGLKATLVGLSAGDVFPIGGCVDVRIDGIELGIRPALSVRRK
ncbi:RNB-domain-containing protein [Wolfiporia cocos MD-104 SS10]|uniref:RNB-domain-containing protein n=1 Tax=Wolfiporia cocos (strain MD-104) TaxID=742152 RepID=A0A2H3JK04_WOLCO|nr:RNB-domain-containing protein [Wolfiporia cocos MD-104 SS10]